MKFKKIVLLVVLAPFIFWVGQILMYNLKEAVKADTIALPKRSVGELVKPTKIGPEFAWGAEQWKQLSREIEKVWGDSEIILPTPTKYVKYTQNYKSRAIVDFDEGTMVIESIDPKDPKFSLKDILVSTLLTPENSEVDLMSAKDPPVGGIPFLYQQITNNEGKPIYYYPRAFAFADEVISKNNIKIKELSINNQKKNIYRLNIPLKADYIFEQAQKYFHHIKASAEKYKLGVRLLLALVKIESSFNPFAVSPASAYGLMQIVPSSAGVEVHTFKGLKGKPDKFFLFDPKNNIEYGAAYIHLLARRYFEGVKNTKSKELCTIVAYNGGPNAVMRIFGKDKTTFEKVINTMSPEAVYSRLVREMPSLESRRYVDKALVALGLFSNYAVKK